MAGELEAAVGDLVFPKHSAAQLADDKFVFYDFAGVASHIIGAGIDTVGVEVIQNFRIAAPIVKAAPHHYKISIGRLKNPFIYFEVHVDLEGQFVLGKKRVGEQHSHHQNNDGFDNACRAMHNKLLPDIQFDANCGIPPGIIHTVNCP